LIIETLSIYLHITFKNNAMTKDEILELIFNEERELYAELQEQRRWYGYDDRGTLHTQAQWGALVNILDKIEENENN